MQTLYIAAQELQKTVAKGSAKPKYEAAEKTADIV